MKVIEVIENIAILIGGLLMFYGAWGLLLSAKDVFVDKEAKELFKETRFHFLSRFLIGAILATIVDWIKG